MLCPDQEYLHVRAEDYSSSNYIEKQIHLKRKPLFTVLERVYANHESTAELKETIDSIIRHPRLKGAVTGVSVRNTETKELLYTNQASTRLTPASNLKIITTIAALDILGPNYQFTTEISVDGPIKNGMLQGDLYIVGKGDPTLQKEDFDDLAKKLREKGVREIAGSIYADDSWYDDVRYSQDLHWNDEYNYTGNAISALTASPNDDYLSGSVIINVSPGDQVGDRPKVTITPETDYVQIENKAKTVKSGKALTLLDERVHGTNKIMIEGDIPMDSEPYERWRAVWEPTRYALNLFTNSLEEHNIKFSKDKIDTKQVAENAKTLFTKKSVPLKKLIIPFMKASNNGLGEVFTKEIGKVSYGEGSWDKGIEVLYEVLEQLEMNISEIDIRDGSGMSHNNLVSANFITDLLAQVKDEAWYPYFKDSFPVAGIRKKDIGGTLRHRLTDDATRKNVRAKTGTLKNVSTLSGYVMTKDGEELAFSILMNNYLKEPVTDFQDEIVSILAELEFN